MKLLYFNALVYGLRTPREEIAFTARPKIQSQSQIFRYGGNIFCLPHRPNFSDIFDLCLHWVSVVRVLVHPKEYKQKFGSFLPIKVYLKKTTLEIFFFTVLTAQMDQNCKSIIMNLAVHISSI